MPRVVAFIFKYRETNNKLDAFIVKFYELEDNTKNTHNIFHGLK